MTQATRDQRPASPCVSICTLDDRNRCQGCGRTLEQIAGWACMTTDEQWAVIDAIAAAPLVRDGTA